MATTNQKLIKLMSKHGLTSSDVAGLVRVQQTTVEKWRQTPGGVGYRAMSKGALELLKIKLGEK